MSLLPKKRPWVVMIILYILIVAGWVVFIVLAKKRHTTRLTPKEATQLYHKMQNERQESN